MWTFSFLCVHTTFPKMAPLIRNILYIHIYSVANADYLNVKAGGTSYHGFRAGNEYSRHILPQFSTCF